MKSKVAIVKRFHLKGFISLNLLLLSLFFYSCSSKDAPSESLNADQILGNPDYQAISYGGYRTNNRDTQPSISELKEDLRILSSMNIKLLRTYNVHLPHAQNLLQAIKELKEEDENFEMYVMLGAWINCLNAWTELEPDHDKESPGNEAEISKAADLANQYPDIVKIIAVGNEAMVKWATSYYVQPGVILKWVTYLQNLKKEGKLSANLWITSSDNFASWGGGSEEYHVEDLNKLISAVDFVSMHTYPMHDTHYNSDFWTIKDSIEIQNDSIEIAKAMSRALDYAKMQYNLVKKYLDSIGIDKPIHIGETGWASYADGHYGLDGSKACDEYKQYLYYRDLRSWTNQDSISCFFFEAFDESWKDAGNPSGSENHFGLFTIDGKAKYAIWDLVDEKVFDSLTRGGNQITKTWNGNKDSIMINVNIPPIKNANK